tara:strand:- start:664 stop:1443 length:780 start_codon:yes stop_codon:yes gene_type:complete
MKKNILIIGFGDLAQRLEKQLLDKDVIIYGLTRSPKKYKGSILKEWDWLNQEPFKAPEKKFDSVIFFPKPADFSESGYKLGFIEPLKIINQSLKDIEFKSFIGISSTRVYGTHQEGKLSELNAPEPSDYRGSIILEYEKLIQSLFQSNSLILRLSGLYDDNTNWLKDFIKNFNGVKRDLPNKYLNRLHRDECARILAFVLKEELYLNNHLFNCSSSSITYEEYFKSVTGSEDFKKYFNNTNDSIRKISSERLRELGFEF